MNQDSFDKARRWGWSGVLAAGLTAVLIAACGGGGGSSASGTATAFASGPISGFGSVIVNGVRFDDSGAHVEDEDGASASSSKLKLGTMVEIESEKVDDNTGRAKALRIRFGSEIVGPVTAVNGTTGFTVLDQIVDVKPETVFDDSLTGGLANLTGKVVEVHAVLDTTTGHYIATRVEDASAATFFKLRGVVASLDTTNHTFQIGAAVINYAGINAADLPAGFADGLKVRVRLQTAQVNGQWVATSIRSNVRKVEDHDDARLRGIVTALDSQTSFQVNGIPVDATNARIDNGPLAIDARVEVRGAAKDGTIVATRVTVLRADDDAVRGVELHGTISDANADTKSFTLRGVKVTWSDTTVLQGLTTAQLVNGTIVEVKGALSADRSTLAAALIKLED